MYHIPSAEFFADVACVCYVTLLPLAVLSQRHPVADKLGQRVAGIGFLAAAVALATRLLSFLENA